MLATQKFVGSFPREHTYWQKKCLAWMQCKSLWIKASDKCKIKICWKCTYPQAIQDADKMQWMGATRMRVQTAYKASQ